MDHDEGGKPDARRMPERGREVKRFWLRLAKKAALACTQKPTAKVECLVPLEGGRRAKCSAAASGNKAKTERNKAGPEKAE